MSRTGFINRHRAQYDRNNLLNDLSDAQRNEGLMAALAEYSQVWPRKQRRVTIFIPVGVDEVTLPFDFLPITGEEALFPLLGEFPIQAGIVSPGVDVFGSQLGATLDPPRGYSRAAGIRAPLEPTTRDDGRYVLPLPSPTLTARSATITYDGLHQIEDAAKAISIVRLPAPDNHVRLGGKNYAFVESGAVKNQIDIAATTVEMAQVIADRVNTDFTATKCMATADADVVICKPARLGPTVIAASDAAGIIITDLPAKNTVPVDQQWIVFRLMLGYALLAKARQILSQDEHAQESSRYEGLAEIEFRAARRHLYNPGGSG